MLNACTIFAQTPVYEKDLHPQGNHLHQRQGGRSLWQTDAGGDEQEKNNQNLENWYFCTHKSILLP